MLGHRLYTKQTGRDGKPVSKLMMCEKLFTRREYYFARKEKLDAFLFLFFFLSNNIFLLIVALERRFGGPVIITSTQGGSNIEEIAAEHPEAIIQYPIDIHKGLMRDEALAIAEKLGFRNQALEQAADTMLKLYDLFVSKDIVLLEINPLTEGADGNIYCTSNSTFSL